MSEIPLAAFASTEPNSFVDGPFGSDLKVSDYSESGVRILQLQNVGDGHFIDDNLKFASEQKALSLARCIVRPGDLLIAKMADPLARACILPTHVERGLIVADLIKLRLDRAHDATYICTAINGHLFRREAERLSNGTTRTRISLSTLKRIKLKARHPTEQRCIGELVRVFDEVIEHTEALIAKQQQVKAGLMHDLFTRGVTATGQLRPPPAEAPHLYQDSPLGPIPKEWGLKSLREIASYQHGQPFPSSDYSDEGVLLLRPGNLHMSGIVRFDAAHTTRLPTLWLRKCPALVLKRDDIVMNLTAQSLDDQFHGRVCIVKEDEPSLLNQRIARFYPQSIRHHFLYWLLKSPQFRSQIDRTMQGTKVQHIYNSDLNRIVFAVPRNTAEQEVIEGSLQSITDELIAETAHLAKLRQQKQGLMHDLLTARVPVPVPA